MPAPFTNTVIVISPLNSIIDDQTNRLKERGILILPMKKETSCSLSPEIDTNQERCKLALKSQMEISKCFFVIPESVERMKTDDKCLFHLVSTTSTSPQFVFVFLLLSIYQFQFDESRVCIEIKSGLP